MGNLWRFQQCIQVMCSPLVVILVFGVDGELFFMIDNASPRGNSTERCCLLDIAPLFDEATDDNQKFIN